MLLGCGHREGRYDYHGTELKREPALLPSRREVTRNKSDKEILPRPREREQDRSVEPGEGQTVANNLDGTGKKQKKNPKIRTKRNRTELKNGKQTNAGNSRGKLKQLAFYGKANVTFSHAHTLFFTSLPLAKIDWPRERGLSRGTRASEV